MASLCCGPRPAEKDNSDGEGGDEDDGKKKSPKLTESKPSQVSTLKRRLSQKFGGAPKPGEPSSSSTGSSSGAGGPSAPVYFGTLKVKVERGEDLMGMDTRVTVSGIETTLDAFVRLALNGQEPFGTTEVQWRSKGDPEWGESFSAPLLHPKSYLCVYVADDDPIFREGGAISLNRNCGFVEIPLWQMPRNKKVKGWFVLNNPDLDQGTLGDRQTTDAPEARKELPSTAGRIQLEITLETTAMDEFTGYFAQQPPVFAKSMPPLDVPGFVEDIMEVKRLILQRLILAPIRAFFYAISWDNPALSCGVLVWHWFVCYFPRFIWTSIWCAVLLCFWHEIPEQKSEGKTEPEGGEEPRKSLITGVFGGAAAAARSVGGGVRDFAVKPVEGAAKGGLSGLAMGMKDGMASAARRTSGAVAQLGKGVSDGVASTVHSAHDVFHGPSLMEFQHILQLKPGLRDMVRGFQPSVDSVHNSLQKADDLFYWADAKVTEKAVKVIAALLVLSILFSGYSKVVSGYGYLFVGTLLMVAKASLFNKIVRALTSAIAVLTRPKVAFQAQNKVGVAQKWFEEAS